MYQNGAHRNVYEIDARLNSMHRVIKVVVTYYLISNFIFFILIHITYTTILVCNF